MYGGIEGGGTKFVCAVGTGPDDLHEVTSFPTTDPDATFGACVSYFEQHAGLEAIGVAVFGPADLDPDSATYGHLTSTPKPAWEGADVVGTLRAALGVPVAFDTDVNGAALGEHRWGAGRGRDPLVYVTVGTGIGGGAIVHGRPLHGLLHPEMGHLPVRRHPDDDLPGTCPYHGDCLEGLAAGPAVAERWGRPAHALGEHEPAAVELQSWYLAQLVVAIVYILAPERIVLGGGVMKLPGLLEGVRAATLGRLAGYLTVPAVTERIDAYLVGPGLGDRAGVLGAIALAQDSP